MNQNSNEEMLAKILSIAKDKAKTLKCQHLMLEHILYAMLKTPQIIKIFKRYSIDYDAMLEETETFILTFPLYERLDINNYKLEVSKHVKVFLGYYSLNDICNAKIPLEDNIKFVANLIASMLMMEDTFAQKILLSYGVTHELLAKIYSNDLDVKMPQGMEELSEEESEYTEFLNQYTINLTEKVQNKDWIPLIGRESELNLLQQIILRHDKPNAILVGNPGIGKTKIIEGLAKIYSDKKKEMTFYQLDTLAFMSNVLLKGEMENRVRKLYQAIKKIGNVILFIDEIHTICGNSDSNSQSEISNLLKPLLTDGTLKVIGTTTFDEYRKYIERDEAFTRRFFRMNVEEPSLEETKKILMRIKCNYEEFFNVKYSESIIDLIIDSCTKYFANKSFPDKAIDIIDMLGASAKYNNIQRIDENMVFKTLSTLLNIPLSNISQSEENLYLNLEENIKKEIIGQEEAVEKVSDAVIISRSGLRESNKTATSLMFTGSSGVGKTAICQSLSKLMNIPLIRFDMSEYMEEHSVSKLIGAPPGYKGFGDGKSGNGLLINAIDEHPNCILLLDEIEKANSKIHNILLQVMDNGKLTSSSGKSVSFEHVYLIMTSNVGSQVSYKRSIGFGNVETENPAEQEYEAKFLPEFRSRIDATVRFNNLSKSVLKDICNKFLGELKNILQNKKIEFKYDEDVVSYIVEKTIKCNNGARPMKHIITNEIKNKIAKNIVFGKYKNGGSIKLIMENDKIIFGEE